VIVNFIVFDGAGRILRTGYCPDNMVEIQAGPGETAVEGEADSAHHEVDVNTRTIRHKATPHACGERPPSVSSPYIKQRVRRQ
jgi:hypothetical protein